MRSTILLLLPFVVTGSMAQITWDPTGGTISSPSATIIWNPPKRALADEPYRCQNGGDLYCCDYIAGRDQPCHNRHRASTAAECRYLACCLSNGHGYYCLDTPAATTADASAPTQTDSV